ncbi:hypothetical protein [Cellulomonas palmilytica]|uniref:hypothetical protein n=1 Tax=Cellulomonas palmilytica TaxID=2608402 RepID=UPI001F31C205|nr:hypothetical protein [Cellulomonas palmilytica]UJP40954.1 hypothetical protein F1D97_05675 [Cellulomonas palmilytica]
MPTRARAVRRHPVVALLVVLAVAVMSVAGAQAAGLSLLAPTRPTAQQLARCAPGPVTVSPTGTATAGQFTQVAVSGVSGSCTVGAVRVASGAAGAWTQSFVSSSSAISGGTFTATGAAFTPPVTANGRAWVTVNGWPVPATWTYAPPAGPVSPGNDSTVMPSIEWTLVTNNPVQVCFIATVSTTSTTPVPWQLRLDLAQAPFNGATSGFTIVNAPGGGDISWKLGITYDQAAMTARIAGKPDVNAPITTITSATTLRFQVCHYGLPPGVQTPSAYTVTYTNSPAWTATRACVTATVTGNGSSRFYFGWTVELDMSAARAAVGAGGWTDLTGNLWQLTRTDLGGNRFRFTSNTAANISGTQSYVFTYCATR